ncbi:hypothetical protein Trydic_g510 [Trypoxylus dichotomus]
MATGEPSRSRSDLARASLEDEGAKMVAGEIDQYENNSLTPLPKSEPTKQKGKEEQELARCIDIIRKMETATDRGRNVSMQIKNCLEEPLDVMTFYRDSWRKVEREIKAPLPENEKPSMNVDQNFIALTPAGLERERVRRKLMGRGPPT